jgi:tRNA G10  N-methylase Trm11
MSNPSVTTNINSEPTPRGDIVVDPFLGSGSTLIAAERAGRWCRGVEIDPLYIDVIIRRYQAETGRDAVLEGTGETFADLAARRRLERQAGDRDSGGLGAS